MRQPPSSTWSAMSSCARARGWAVGVQAGVGSAAASWGGGVVACVEQHRTRETRSDTVERASRRCRWR